MSAKNCLIALLVTAAVTAWPMAQPAYAAPQPGLVAPAGTWQLDFELHGDPRQITITLPGSSEPTTCWYLLYTITNKTGQDIVFYPQFELFTDTFKLYRAGVNVRRPVFEAIRSRYAGTIPLLEPASMITGQAGLGQAKGILQGSDNARDSVAIFGDFDPNAAVVKLFVAGLSNETIKVTMPANVSCPDDTYADTNTRNEQQFLLRKTLMLEYQVVGDIYQPGNRVLLYRNRSWVMR